MKPFMTLLTLLTLAGASYSCNRTEEIKKSSDNEIQREEEFRRDDYLERQSVPSETRTNNEIQIDRKVIDEDDLELDQ